MTVRELAAQLNALMPAHGDCDVCTTSTDGSEYLAPVRKVWSNVTPAEGEGFPILVLVVETDQGDVLPDGREGREDAGLSALKGQPAVFSDAPDVDDTPECPECPHGRGSSMGFLGSVLWFRCRQCGSTFNMQGV